MIVATAQLGENEEFRNVGKVCLIHNGKKKTKIYIISSLARAANSFLVPPPPPNHNFSKNKIMILISWLTYAKAPVCNFTLLFDCYSNIKAVKHTNNE